MFIVLIIMYNFSLQSYFIFYFYASLTYLHFSLSVDLCMFLGFFFLSGNFKGILPDFSCIGGHLYLLLDT